MKPISILALVMLVMLAGCGPEPTITVQTERSFVPTPEQSTRFKVERVAVFEDAIAYGNRRGIYIITDTETGQEFVGVSGVGVTETGSHTCGKSCIVQDER
jgi:hypothetical protein